MILFLISVFANEISFAIRDDIHPQEWMAEQRFSGNIVPLLSTAMSENLQKRAPESVPLHHLFRWKGDEAESDKVLLALQNDRAIQWVALRHHALPPPPIDTPDFLVYQEYVLPNPGMDIISFWEEGYKGNGIHIADIEYGWGLLHEDLQEEVFTLNPNYLPHSDVEELGYADHGTAVLGVLSAQENGFGCTGIAHHAQIELVTEYPQDGWDRPFAMARAIENLKRGDILLLEMQDYGACEDWACLVPAEIDPEVWSMTRLAVDAGIVVIAAAGNGSQNLDDVWYEENYLSLGDSGAIIVGAGMPNLDHGWGLLNYGSRIDIQGWGYDVTTLGLETLAELDHDPLRAYTHTFSGTSASSALVAGAIGLLQEWSVDQLGHPLSPLGLRRLLYDSGDVSIDYVPHINIVRARALLLSSDQDEDGFFDAYYGGKDCDDHADLIHPNAQEDWYDGIDQNCDGRNDFDQDGDGYTLEEDCDDVDSQIHPSAQEDWYDGIDQNCDGWDDFDQDGDGYTLEEDCDDVDSQIHPSAQEDWYDGIDQNCDGRDDFDQDGDGYTLEEDCNDVDGQTHPQAQEIPRDSIDQDCDGEDPLFFGCQAAPFSGSYWLFLCTLLVMRVRR